MTGTVTTIGESPSVSQEDLSDAAAAAAGGNSNESGVVSVVVVGERLKLCTMLGVGSETFPGTVRLLEKTMEPGGAELRWENAVLAGVRRR